MRPLILAVTTMLAATGTAAFGQAAAPATTAAAQIKPGATVYDTSGAQAATIVSTSGDLVVVSTGTNKISLPMASFAAGPNGPVVSVTKAQIDAAAVQANAQAAAALKTQLVAGATVHGSGGASAGTVKTVGADTVVVATPSGDASLPLTAFSSTPQGVTIAMSAAELNAAVAAAAPK